MGVCLVSVDLGGEDSNHRRMALWKVQSRYAHERTITSVNRLDVLKDIDRDAALAKKRCVCVPAICTRGLQWQRGVPLQSPDLRSCCPM